MAFKMKNILSLFLATLLIVFFLSFLFVFIFATPNNRAMKCNDPDINQPVTRRENWFGLIMAMFMPAFLNCFLIIPNLKQVTSKQRSDSIVFLVPNAHLPNWTLRYLRIGIVGELLLRNLGP